MLKTFIVQLPQKLLKLLGTLSTHVSSHSFLVPLVVSFCKKIRRRYLIIFLISLVIFDGSCYLWKVRQQSNSLALPSTPSLTKEIQTIRESKDTEEEGEEKEERDGNDTLSENNPWTLLQTALPPYYSAASFQTETPAVAFIVTGLGLNKDWTGEVLATLRGNVTVVLSPYSQNIGDQLLQAQMMGYQGMIGLPMEPYGYPNPDPGPLTILTGAPPEDNRHKTKTVLEKTPKGTGVMGEYGSRFTISEAELEPVLTQIRNHGGLFIDPRTSLYSKVPKICKVLDMNCYQVDLKLDQNISSKEADEFLKKIIQNAKENGIVIVSTPAVPTFINHLVNWIDALEEEGVDLVTIADLTQTPRNEVKDITN